MAATEETRSVSQLSVAITNTSDKPIYKDEMFALTHGSRSFCPWSLSPLLLWACGSSGRYGTSVWLRRSAGPVAAEKQRGKKHMRGPNVSSKVETFQEGLCSPKRSTTSQHTHTHVLTSAKPKGCCRY